MVMSHHQNVGQTHSLLIAVNLNCYHTVHSLLSSWVLSKNLKIKIYKTIILSVVLYRCET